MSRMMHSLSLILIIVGICHSFFPKVASLPAHAATTDHADKLVKPRQMLIDHDGGVDDFIALMMLMAAVHGEHAELIGVIVTEVDSPQ